MSQKNKLFVGGLSQTTTEKTLYDAFSNFGVIDDACIVYDKETQNSRGFGYVLFQNAEDAERAKNDMSGNVIDSSGKPINVEYANEKDPAKEAAKRSGRPMGGGYGGGYGGGRGRGGGFRGGRGGPRGRGGPGGFRGRGPPPDRRPPPRYDGGYGGGYDDQYNRPQRPYDRQDGGYGYNQTRDSYNDGYNQRADVPPPRHDAGYGGGYDRYPPSNRGRPVSAGGDGYGQDQGYGGGDSYDSQGRYGGPPNSAGRDW